MELVKQYSFEEAKNWLPEEQKRRLEIEIKAKRERLVGIVNPGEAYNLQREILDAEKRLEALGGDTRKQLEKVLSVYNIEQDSRWFIEGYQNFEEKLLKGTIFGNENFEGLLERFRGKDGKPLDVSELVVDDRGMGTGRSLRMLMDIVKKERNRNEARLFAKNLHGVDLMPKNLEEALRSFRNGSYGFPDGNISAGSYLDPSDARTDAFGAEGKKAHLIISMMHSCFYNVTEEDWCTFFARIKEDLLPGGIFIFDTIAMPNFEPDEIEQKIPYLDDWRDLYTRLWMEYCTVNQRFMGDQERKLELMPRYPIFDNTTGQGFYNREVPTFEFINYIIKKIGGGLSINMAKSRQPEFGNRGSATQLGRKWLRDNNFDKKINADIASRLRDGKIKTSEILERSITGRRKIRRTREALINDVAYSMTSGYRDIYVSIEKDKEHE